MAERVHPVNNLSWGEAVKEYYKEEEEEAAAAAAANPDDPRPAPVDRKFPSGTFVVKVPKNQVYRVPPSENARLYESYSRRDGARRNRRRCSPCRRTLPWLLALLLFLAAAAAALYFVLRPAFPAYSVAGIRVKGFGANPTRGRPEFDVAMVAENRNEKIGVYYLDGGDVTVTHAGVVLGRGAWPAFFHGRRNVTEFRTTLKGGQRPEVKQQSNVPLEIDARVPVRVGVGSLKSWTVDAKVECDVLVDGLTQDATVLSNNCTAFSSFW